MDIRYRQGKKKLIVEVQDPAFRTPFERTLIAEILTNIFTVLDGRETKFEYFKDGDTFGFKTNTRKDNH